MPVELLPVRQPKESDWSYFRRIHEWRVARDLPEQVFVTIPGARQAQDGEEDDKKNKIKLGRDDYKPQYMSFTNPILIRLLEKIIEKTPRALEFSEMLPAPDRLLEMDGRRHVTEFVLEWRTGDQEVSR